MSDAQIWIAIVLGFILLAMAINAFRNLGGRRPLKELRDRDQAVQDELTRIGTGIAAVSTKVDDIERMLVEVQ